MAQQDVVGSLFGVTPEAYQQQQDALLRQQATQFAAMQPMQQAQYGAYIAGNKLGGAAAGLMGVEDPQLALVRQTNQLVQQIGVDTPEKLKTLAGELQKLPGGAALAAQAIDKANKMLESQATVIAKTREQLPTVAKLQIYRDKLVELYGANDPRVAQVDAVIKAEGEGKAPKVNVQVAGQKNVLEIDKKAAENLQKAEESSATVIERLQEQKQALQKGIIGGQFSDARTAFANSLAAFGIKDKKTMEMLADTKRFNTNRIELASAVAKQLGVNPTDRDFQASLSRFASASDDPSVSLQFIDDMLAISTKQNTQAREGLDYYRRNDGSFAGYQKPLPRSAIVEQQATDRLSQLKAEQAKRNK